MPSSARFSRASLTISLLALVVALGACGDDVTGRTDASPIDGGTLDGMNGDGGNDASMDAGPDAPSLPIQGQLTYVRRPLTSRGLEAPTTDSLGHVQVLLLQGGRELSSTLTAEDGSFGFAVEPTPDMTVRVVAAVETPSSIGVTDFDGNLYAFEGPVTEGVATLAVEESTFAGALAILDTMAEGLTFAATAFSRPDAFPDLRVYWERGRSTPGGTSYAAGDELWILGGPEDTDEFDTPVLLHELGHYLQWVYDFYDVVPGDFHAGADTDARLAWGEGWASFFSSLARGSSFYGDSYGDALAYDLHIDALPAAGEYVCNPAAGVEQTLSEWVIAASLYELAMTGDRSEQQRRSFAAVSDWLTVDRTDRGLPGVDFVDFLDGYLCLAEGAQDALVQEVIVEGRRYPHDLDPPCPKPGDSPQLRNYLIVPPVVTLPGYLHRDLHGRSLRVIPLGT